MAIITKKIKVEEPPSHSLLNCPVPRKGATVSGKSKKPRARAGVGEPVPKRVRHSPSIGTTDIVVVVGGKAFHEDGHHFACSGLIERSVKNGVRHFDFGEKRDASEWAFIRKLLDPFSDTRITKDTLPTALDWFQALEITKGVSQCDQLLADKVLTVTLPLKRCKFTNDLQMTASDLEEVLDVLPLTLRYDLPVSKKKCFTIVRQVMKEGPFWLDLELATTIHSLVSSSQECQTELMDSLKAYVPRAATSKMDELWGSALFPVLILSGIEAKGKERKLKRQTDRMLGIVASMPTTARVAGIKKTLKKDKICRKMLPKQW